MSDFADIGGALFVQLFPRNELLSTLWTATEFPPTHGVIVGNVFAPDGRKIETLVQPCRLGYPPHKIVFPQ